MADKQRTNLAKQSEQTKSLTIMDVQVTYEINKKRWYLPRFVYQMVADDFSKTTFSKNGNVVLNMVKVPRPDVQFGVSDLASTGSKPARTHTKSAINPPSDPKRKANT